MSKTEKKQFAVIGLGRFGTAVATTLYEQGKEVLALDIDQELITEIADSVTYSIAGDATDEHVLKSLGLRNFDTVVIAIGNNMQASILATLLCKELGAKYIVAKAQSETHKKVLQKIGADMVIFPEESMGRKIATLLSSSTLVELTDIDNVLKIAEISLPESWLNKNLSELEIRQKTNLTVLVVKRGKEVVTSPSGEFSFILGDKIILCGALSDIQRIAK